MATVYILYSKKINQYYIGSCLDLAQRIQEHISNKYKGFTARTQDWEIFFEITNLEYQQARSIEKHIKSMKSTTYFVNIKKHEEIAQKLIQKYK
ncbi:endonuclease [Dokdonia sp. Dokd-P16]|uniref:GIY-YIG nuclease family protein n=1 Tax=Dokdonia sp. Dokd-P16 TaxID=2173169 RepID=UPI000D54A74E|nr:endonuclease [Dokdonia sp. Dokd-P16]